LAIATLVISVQGMDHPLALAVLVERRVADPPHQGNQSNADRHARGHVLDTSTALPAAERYQ